MRVRLCEMNDSVNNRYKSEGDTSPSALGIERQTTDLIIRRAASNLGDLTQSYGV